MVNTHTHTQPLIDMQKIKRGIKNVPLQKINHKGRPQVRRQGTKELQKVRKQLTKWK